MIIQMFKQFEANGDHLEATKLLLDLPIFQCTALRSDAVPGTGKVVQDCSDKVSRIL